MNFRAVIKVLTENGFELKRQKGSHRAYEGFVHGKRRLVTIACHQLTEEVRPKTFASIVRQSGLGKEAFPSK